MILQIIKFIIDNKDIIINDISNLDDQNTAKFIFTIKEIKNHWDNALNEISKSDKYRQEYLDLEIEKELSNDKI